MFYTVILRRALSEFTEFLLDDHRPVERVG